MQVDSVWLNLTMKIKFFLAGNHVALELGKKGCRFAVLSGYRGLRGLSGVQSLAINRFTPANDQPHCPVVIMLKYFVNIMNMKLRGLLIVWQFLVCCGHCFWWESTGLKQT